MKTTLIKRIRVAAVCVCGLFILVLFSACSGIAGVGSNGTTSVTGTVQSVNASAHSVVLSVNGQQLTVSGLTDQQVTALQTQVGKTYSFQVGADNNGSYTINTGTDPTESDNGTPGVTSSNDNNTPVNTGANAVGSLSFIGKVQSASNGTMTVIMPGSNKALSFSINNLTDQSDFNGTLPGAGQYVKVDAQANADGSFTATKLGQVDSNDAQDVQKLNTVDYQGVTTQAVGSNGNISVKVGNNTYVFTIGSSAEVKDFNGAQSIPANQAVKVEVLFNGSNALVQQVSNASN